MATGRQNEERAWDAPWDAPWHVGQDDAAPSREEAPAGHSGRLSRAKLQRPSDGARPVLVAKLNLPLEETTKNLSAFVQFFPKPVTNCNLQGQNFFELHQHRIRPGRVMAVFGKIFNELTLTPDMECALGDVPFGDLKVIDYRSAIHIST